MTAGPAVAASGDDARASASQLSDGAFALLNAITAAGTSASPALGPVASFAGDAQTLSRALTDGDQPGTGSAMASLLADRKAVDAAVSTHPGAINPAQWNSLKRDLDSLAQQVKPAAAAAPATALGTALAAPPPTAASTTPQGSASRGGDGDASEVPRVHIDSYAVMGHAVHVKGYFEGVALKSAGVYQSGQLVRDLRIDQLPGRQHVTFDIELANVEPDMVLKVYDGAGLSAGAPIASRLGIDGSGRTKEVELEPPTDAPVSLGGADVGPVENASPGHNVAEIPAPSGASPSNRHNIGRAHSHLGDLQVNIISVALDDSQTRTYDIIGQISGSGVGHAGIYVDGSLAKPIDIDGEQNYTTQPFDETFQMLGRRAAVRVYNQREEYLESAIRFASARPEIPPDEFPGLPPMIAMNPNQLAVQVSSLRQVAPNVLVVTGVLSGKNMSAAGLYQNGIEVQALPVSSGVLGALTSAAFQQVNFTAQFNPVAGPASVRLFASDGQFTEQPLLMAGVNPYGANPYGANVNPYGYGNSYGPRYANPYGYPGNPPPPSSSSQAPWWMKLLR